MRTAVIILVGLMAITSICRAETGVDDDLLGMFSSTPSIDEVPEFAGRDRAGQFVVIASSSPAATDGEALNAARAQARREVSLRILATLSDTTRRRSQAGHSAAEIEQILEELSRTTPLEAASVIREIERSYGTLFRAVLLVDVSERRVSELSTAVERHLIRRSDQRTRSAVFRTIGYSVSILSPLVLFAVLNRLTRGYVVHILAPAGAAVALVGVTGTYLLL